MMAASRSDAQGALHMLAMAALTAVLAAGANCSQGTCGTTMLQKDLLRQLTTSEEAVVVKHETEESCGFEAGTQPYCGLWAQKKTDHFDWTHRTGKTPSCSTGPQSGAAAGSYYMYIEASCPRQYGETAVLVADGQELAQGAFLTFQYHMYGSSMGALIVKVVSPAASLLDAKVGQTKVWEVTGNQGNSWKSATLDLSSYAGQTVDIEIEAVVGKGYTSDVAIDEVTLNRGQSGPPTPAPPSPPPTPAPECGGLDDVCRGEVDWAYNHGRWSNPEWYVDPLASICGISSGCPWNAVGQASKDDFQQLFFCGEYGEAKKCALPPCQCTNPPCNDCGAPAPAPPTVPSPPTPPPTPPTCGAPDSKCKGDVDWAYGKGRWGWPQWYSDQMINISGVELSQSAYEDMQRLFFCGEYGASKTCALPPCQCTTQPCDTCGDSTPAATPAPTSAATSAPSTTASDASTWVVDAHNLLRCTHCDTPVLTWSSTLAAEADACAQTCPTGHTCPRNGAGENLYFAGSTGLLVEDQNSWNDAIQSWYGEEPDWNYATSSSDGGVVGHFTQVVWKSSTQVGCAMNVNCNNKFPGFNNNVVVCRYSPAGNYMGQEAANVMDLVSTGSCGGASDTCPR